VTPDVPEGPDQGAEPDDPADAGPDEPADAGPLAAAPTAIPQVSQYPSWMVPPQPG
jgi:hypothetical protein